MQLHHFPCLVFLLSGIAALLGATPSAHAADPARDAEIEKAVLAANTAMIGAANRLDIDGLFDYIVDSGPGVIVQNGVIFKTRREAYEAVKRGMQGVTKVERRIDNPHITIIAPDAALLVGDGNMTATLDDGRTMTSRFAVSLVFVQRDGRWKVLHGHYSMLPDSWR